MPTGDRQMELPIKGNPKPTAFFAYPSQSYLQSEAIRSAAADINKTQFVKIRTWEDMSVTGKNIMQEICTEISRAQIFCGDITGLNPNVMFELGYAIARDKGKREERWKEKIEIEAKDMKRERGFGRKDEDYSKAEWPAHDYTDAPAWWRSWERKARGEMERENRE
jgi:hypothetical protein